MIAYFIFILYNLAAYQLTTIINWVKEAGKLLPDCYDPETNPEVGELDELQTFVGSKKTKPGCGQP